MTHATFAPPLQQFRPGVFAQEGETITWRGTWGSGSFSFLYSGWHAHDVEQPIPPDLGGATGHDAELWKEWRHGKRPPRGYHATALGDLLEEGADHLPERPDFELRVDDVGGLLRRGGW